MPTYKKTPEALSKLTPEQFRVTQQSGTEMPGTGALCTTRSPASTSTSSRASRLFASSDKFESGCGWPSFTKPIEPANVNELQRQPRTA